MQKTQLECPSFPSRCVCFQWLQDRQLISRVAGSLIHPWVRHAIHGNDFLDIRTVDISGCPGQCHRVTFRNVAVIDVYRRSSFLHGHSIIAILSSGSPCQNQRINRNDVAPLILSTSMNFSFGSVASWIAYLLHREYTAIIRLAICK
jgi:hypothetical protein